MTRGEERVAGIDRLGFPPERPDRRAVPAQMALVLNIVMDQGEVVQELDGRGDRCGERGIDLQRGRHEHCKPRAHALAGVWALTGNRRKIGVSPSHVIRGNLLEQRRGDADFGDCLLHDRLEERVERGGFDWVGSGTHVRVTLLISATIICLAKRHSPMTCSFCIRTGRISPYVRADGCVMDANQMESRMVFDPWYFVFILPGFLLSMWAQSKVKGNFEKYSQVRNSAGLTGAQTSRRILDDEGLNSIPIEQVAGCAHRSLRSKKQGASTVTAGLWSRFGLCDGGSRA